MRRIRLHRMLTVLAVLLISTMLATACGGGAAPAPASAPAPAAPAAASPAPAPAAPAASPAPAAPAAATPTAAAPAAASPAAAAPASSPAAAAPRQNLPERVIVADAAEIETLDGTLRAVTNHRRVYGHIYDPLVHRDPTGKIVPWLALSWEQQGAKITFKLRQNVKFHNGEPFNAAAVKFSLDRERDPKISQVSTKLSTIEAVNVVDDYTVEVVTKQADPLLIPTGLTDNAYIAPPKYAQEKGIDTLGTNPVGTGPYKFVEWKKGEQLTMTANADYWGGAPGVKTVIFKPIPEAATRVAALINGEIDIAAELPASQVARLKSSPTVEVSTAVDPLTIWVGLRPDIEPLRKKEVRQALNYAVNKDLIVEKIWQGLAKPLNGPLFEEAFGYNKNLKPYPYDPAKAKELLAQAGYPNGFEMTMEVPIGGVAQAKEVAQAVAGDLDEVGVKVNLVQSEWAELLKRFFTPKSSTVKESFVIYVKSPALDGDEILNTTFRSDGEYPDGWNWSAYKNPEVDKLIAAERATFDPAERQQAMAKAQEIIREDAPHIFLYAPQAIFGVKKGLGWKARPDGMIWIADDLK